MSSSDSLFPVSKNVALAGAERCIKSIKRHRQQVFEESVDKLMNRRFFRPANRAKAEKIVRSEGDGDFPPHWKICAGRFLGRAADIIKACKVTDGDTVYLTAYDAALVYDYQEENL